MPAVPCMYECLQYRAGVGTLDATVAQSYLLNVTCSDNKEAPAYEIIEIKVIPNEPPYFDPDFLFVANTIDASVTSGSVLYDVDVKDAENDDIKYTLKVKPTSSSSNYAINQFTGEIRALIDMKQECRNDVTFEVTINDGKNTVGPLVIDNVITNANTAPVATNLDRTIQIPEDATGTAYRMFIQDGNAADKVTYTYIASNAAGVKQFNLDGTNPNIDIKTALDYEAVSLRQTDLVIQATDGYCTSPQYNLRLKVTDVNEKPTISPVISRIQLCEGQQEFDPGYVLSDPDTIDTHRWTLSSKMANPNGRFGIDPNTGTLKTLMDYDVDKVGKMTATVTYIVQQNKFPVTHIYHVMTIASYLDIPYGLFYTCNIRSGGHTVFSQVEDKGGLTATASVVVTFLDCNDNAPVFVQPAYGRSATDCTPAGTALAGISATDDDSSREQNNVIYYVGSGGSVSVGTGGEIIVNQALPAGSVVTFNAYAYDKGQTPGPLRSANPAVISVRFTPCPTTTPPVTAAPTQAPVVTTTKAIATTVLVQKKDDSNLPWIIIAALLGTFMLGLLIYMLWRYGSLCLNACGKINCRQRCCRPRMERIRTPPKIERRPPMQKEYQPPTQPVREPDPIGPGFLFGFWKERYPDDDFKTQPDRKRPPTPGDMEQHYPHTVDPVEDPLTEAEAAPHPKKKQRCSVM
ncbi:cadherin EGF LAG seven-pass G-type receptor 2-like [Physella acuta]|uniref:cadherin EGF LAG seven-pass G-type receptor 2-like n=1 Tax=Physella acuta TaxID=109671 RepID=UPI0027DCDD77|nr:cadherin EGF LAG seven-pass G-type receptor 2-like [Physella acuta]